MDALSEVLRVVKLESAFFYNGEFSAPWRFRSPESCKLAAFIRDGAGHVVVYHLLLEGRVYAEAQDVRLQLRPGDIVIFPHGDPHVIESGPSPYTIDGETELQRIFSCGLKQSRMGGGGEISRFVCGFLMCEPRMSQVFLAGLPSVFKVNIRDGAAGEWLEKSIQYSISQAGSTQSGSEAVLAKLSETLFVETLRRYVAELPEHQTGWLAGARNPEVGKALALMHSRPEEPWTIEGLAREVGLSRSVLAQRFRQYLGEPPLAYLTRWRLQLGMQMMASTNQSVAQIASTVGYESESAFNRAFKREFGDPPARYRSKARQLVGRASAPSR
ncbi:MAG: AraC family transcriptional regulator [Terriglobia bacterium]|jgi:AraC-like DNA-binding protein|nr:AraC family transcriptional regulator [Terriglobia bacterium]